MCSLPDHLFWSLRSVILKQLFWRQCGWGKPVSFVPGKTWYRKSGTRKLLCWGSQARCTRRSNVRMRTNLDCNESDREGESNQQPSRKKLLQTNLTSSFLGSSFTQGFWTTVSLLLSLLHQESTSHAADTRHWLKGSKLDLSQPLSCKHHPAAASGHFLPNAKVTLQHKHNSKWVPLTHCFLGIFLGISSKINREGKNPAVVV